MDKKKKEINKKEVKNIAASGLMGGMIGAAKGAGDVAFNNHKTYSKIKKAYINSNIDKYIEQGMSKKDAYKHVIDEFSKKKLSLNKIIPEYTGTAKHNLANAYKIKALSEMPYKAIGGAFAGIPIGMLAYGQISSMLDNIDKKALDNMVYFEKISKQVK